MAVISLNKNNFDKEVMQSEGLVLVDFFAEWCGPCHMMSPVIEQVAENYKGKVKVFKVNVDNEEELALKFEAFSIPTFVLIKDKKVIAKTVGYQPYDKFKIFVDNQLKN